MVKQRSNIIQFNGRRYDATTGRLLDNVVKPQPISDIVAVKSTPQVQPINKAVKPKNIDDIRRPANGQQATKVHKRTSKSVTLTRTVPKPVITATKTSPVAKPVPASRTVNNSLVAHRPVKSPTLMRTAVKKPVIARKPKLSSTTNTSQIANKPSGVIAKKHMSDNLDIARLERSKQTPRHGQVDRFYKPTNLVTVLAAKAPAHIQVRPAPAVINKTAPKSDDILTKALHNARSHEEVYKPLKRVKRKSHKLLASLAITASLLLFMGGLAYVNRSHIQMQFAAAQAGFNASLPSYIPGGFVYSGISYGTGEITLTYTDASSNTSYTINQKPSSWNSQTLLDSFSENTHDYQVQSAGGRTVYILTDQVTWVSGGIIYKLVVNGNQLPLDQILKVVASL